MDLLQLRQLLDSHEYERLLSESADLRPDSALDEAAMLIMRTEAMIGLGQYDAQYVDRAISILLNSHDVELLPQAKYARAQILLIESNLMEAREELSEAYYGFKRLGNLRGMGRTASWLALTFHQTGDYAVSLQYNDRALGHYREGGYILQIGMCLSNLGISSFRAGFLQQSSKAYEEIARDYVSIFTEEHLYNFHHGFALVHTQLGRFSLAQKEMAEAAKLPKSLRREYFRHFEISGYLYTLTGEFEKAESFLREGEKIAFEIAPNSTFVSQVKRLFADVYILTWKFDLAEKYALEGLAVAEKINERLEIAACYRVLAPMPSRARPPYRRPLLIHPVPVPLR